MASSGSLRYEDPIHKGGSTVYRQQSFNASNFGAQGTNPTSAQSSAAAYGSGLVQSQYRGLNKSFQPTGYVQSKYGQNQNQNISGFGFSNLGNQANQYQSFAQSSQAVSPQAYHAANYRGNQAGHDQYLRADSVNPSSFQNQNPSSSALQSGVSAYQPTSAFAQTKNQFQNQQAFHSANYRGNQQGHDQYLRADSVNPSQFG